MKSPLQRVLLHNNTPIISNRELLTINNESNL